MRTPTENRLSRYWNEMPRTNQHYFMWVQHDFMLFYNWVAWSKKNVCDYFVSFFTFIHSNRRNVSCSSLCEENVFVVDLFPYKRTCLLTIQAGLSVTPSISVPKSGRQLHVFPPGAVVDIVRCSFSQRHVRKIYIIFPCYFCRLFYNHHKLTWYRLWRLRKGHLNHPKKRFFNSVLVTEFDLYQENTALSVHTVLSSITFRFRFQVESC